ncbi:hypothetical protein ASC84_19075 [Acinetobacter sp. Root1280]|uniref:hypothetical protein n=1 Tax=Acinetobacter sp. Root1280 TaxID=1736444 RepID=UPI0007009355|nr:hypothetical protein [Acinetobacter sp. Root1280]KQX00133.1 hypothetical protein ASC84_19075 [Acinetobacter sp. Root1280]
MRRIVLASLLALSGIANAASEPQDKQKVFNIVKEYSKLVSCMSSFEKDSDIGKPTTIKDVHTVEYEKDSKSFYVMWYGDMGCAGGSGTMSGFVSEVAIYGGEWKPYTIQSDTAFGSDLDMNFRFIESLKKINSNKFEIISWDYADDKYGGKDGGNNFPANKFKYVVERVKWDPWKITQKTLLKQNK